MCDYIRKNSNHVIFGWLLLFIVVVMVVSAVVVVWKWECGMGGERYKLKRSSKRMTKKKDKRKNNL